MFDMYLINSASNREELRKLGFHLVEGNSASYIRVDLHMHIAIFSIYASTSPIFDVNHVAELMVLPDFMTRVFYLLSEKIITRFNPHVPQEYILSYYKMINTRTYPAPQG